MEDWESIKTRANAFSEFGLDWWLKELNPILDYFIEAKKGNADPKVWQSFYHWSSMSGGATITGWVTALFPYLQKSSGLLIKNDDMGDTRGWGTDPGLFPIGVSKIPFIWEYYDTEYKMEFLGGFMGVSQEASNQYIRPVLGWAVADAVK